MSDITPPSFIDDGTSFTKCSPHGLHPAHVANWVDATGSPASAYTGSFVDDGADMLLPSPHAPGFGQIDSRFYEQWKREEVTEGVWNEDVQTAVSGDIQRSLEKLRGLGELEVKRESARREQRDTITVPVPRNWGSIVIKGENGRVIVVDREGGFDSGPQKAVSEQEDRWVKGSSIIEPLSTTEVSNNHGSAQNSEEPLKDDSKNRSRRHSHSHKHKKSRHKHVSSTLSTTLTSIPESAYESGYLASGGKEVLSPTGFFMTGGASGWPSRAATSVASPALSASKAYNYSVLDVLEAFRSKPPIRSPPGGWPSPAPSLVKSVAPSEQQWSGEDARDVWKEDKSRHSERGEKSRRSHKSGRSHRSRREGSYGLDNMSTKSHSTYKSPAVEDAPDISSPEKKANAATGWGGSGKGSDNGWKQSKKGSEGGWIGSEYGSKKSSKVASQNGWGGSKTSQKSWKGSAKVEGNNGWAGGPSPGDDNWDASDKQSETSWDGFEKVKTLSEVSVAGSGSDRSSLSSPIPSRHSAKPSTHHSSRHGSQNGWGGGQQSWGSPKARVDDDARAGSQKSVTSGWGGSKRRSSNSASKSEPRRTEHPNAYDEENQTHGNHNWGGALVRVGSGETAVSGWE